MTLFFIMFLILYFCVSSVWLCLVCDIWPQVKKWEPKPFLLPPEQYPECLQGYSEIANIYIGDCILHDEGFIDFYFSLTGITLGRLDADFGLAHAHPRMGAICFRHRSQLQSKNLCLHELAHLCVPSRESHGPLFRAKVLELGGSLDYDRNPNTNEWGSAYLDRNIILDQLIWTYYVFIIGPIQRLREIFNN
jgi:hypothetical protein